MNRRPFCHLSFAPLIAASLAAAQTQFAEATPKPAESNPFQGRWSNAILAEDFNGDGHQDLFFGNDSYTPSFYTPSQLLLGDGAFHFAAQHFTISPPGGIWFAVAADIDADGDADILALGGQRQLLLLLNDGQGLFTDETTSRIQPPPNTTMACLVTGDVDNDGDVDLVIGCGDVNAPGQNRLFRNDGSGHFTDATQGGLPYANDLTTGLTLVDIDGDQDLDLLTANRSSQCRMALNDGSGHFVDVTATHIPAGSYDTFAIVAGDVDGDQDVDVVIGNTAPSCVLLLNDGTGRLHLPSTAQLPSWGSAVTVVLQDLDGDQDLDLFLGIPRHQSQFFANDGTGRFVNATAARLPSFQSTVAAATSADFNADGNPDLALACIPVNWHPEPLGRNLVLQNVGGGSFVDRPHASREPWGGMLPAVADMTTSVLLLDVDADGDLDLVVGNESGQQDRLYSNDGNGVFADVTATRMPSSTANTTGMAAGDVDGDGRIDIVSATYHGQIRLSLGNNSGGFGDATVGRIPIGSYPTVDVVLGDLDGDGDLDAVFGAIGQDRVYVNNGAGHFTDNTTTALPPDVGSTRRIHLADLDGDGDLDIMQVGSSFRVLVNNGTGTFTTRTMPGPFAVSDAVAADLDGDGDVDLFLIFGDGYARTETWRVLRNNGAGLFLALPAASAPGGTVNQALAADIDDDGDLDVVTAAAPFCTQACAGGQNKVYVNLGADVFAPVPIGAETDATRAVAVGDTDGDGDLDVVSGNRAPAASGTNPGGFNRIHANLARHLEVPNAPRVGGSLTTRSTSMTPLASGPFVAATFLSLGLAQPPVSLPPHGSLRLDSATLATLAIGTTSGGVFQFSLPLPNAPALAGLDVMLQAVVEGKAPGGTPVHRFTNALRETIGP